MVMAALGWSSWKTLRDTTASERRWAFALAGCVVAVVVLAVIALHGLSTDRYEPPRAFGVGVGG